MEPTVVAWLDRTPKMEIFIQKNGLTPLGPSTRKTIVAQLPMLEGDETSIVYQIPPGLNETLFIRCAELHVSPGLTCKVICGLSGKALRPYYRIHNDEPTQRGQAFFSIPNAVIAITAGDGLQGLISIKKYRLFRTRNRATLRQIPFWQGWPTESLPSSLRYLQRAIDAALLKTQIKSSEYNKVFYAA